MNKYETILLDNSTEFYEDFKQYYRRAEEMQKKSLDLPYKEINDPLMENVHIYNCTLRKNAGFSNMLEDIWKGNNNTKTFPGAELPGILPMEKKDFDIYTWHYLFLVHRITGSGASFEPDHGYRNTIIPDLVKLEDWIEMIKYIKHVAKPIFTSKGNQIPPFNKPSHPYEKGGIEYLVEIAPIIACTYVDWLRDAKNLNPNKSKTIQEAVDFVVNFQSTLGWKKFHFVLTAFVMDTAEYFPDLVDPSSHCYYGSNALEAMDLLFGPWEKGMTIPKKVRYDMLMDSLCQVCRKPDGSKSDPYSMEDVLCDYIRYVENYVPKWYMDNFEYDKLVNNSLIKNHEPNWLKIKYTKILNEGLFDA